MPYFRLIMVCLSYLFERRPRLDLKDPTIAVVIAHKRKIKKAIQLRRVLSVDQMVLYPIRAGSNLLWRSLSRARIGRCLVAARSTCAAICDLQLLYSCAAAARRRRLWCCR